MIELFQNIKFKFKLTIAGGEDNLFKKSKNIKFIKDLSNQIKIINLYDSHNIFILPSYTEGSPKVILESLVRKKPIILHSKILLKSIEEKVIHQFMNLMLVGAKRVI